MKCKEENCNNKVVSRGWCWMHYSRWRRNRDVGGSQPTKRGGFRENVDYKYLGHLGGLARKRGYFGKLKDQGGEEEIKRIAQKGGANSRKNVTPHARKAEVQVNKTAQQTTNPVLDR